MGILAELTNVTLHVTIIDNYGHGTGYTVTATPTLHLGGFQEAADLLSRLSQRKYSRQSVHQLWKRRSYNAFPDRKTYLINGYTKHYFDIAEVESWYRWQKDLQFRVHTGKAEVLGKGQP